MKIRAANGYYMPSCFYMFIESEGKIEDIIENNKQTFFHEYIHFLQDIIFPYNIRYTLTENRKFKYVNIVTLEHGTINRPFDTWDEDTKLTDEQLHYTWGDNKFIDKKKSIREVRSSYFVIYTDAKIYKYEIIFEDGESYQIGARDLLEYIADTLESCNWPTHTPDLPYRTVDIIFEHYGHSDISKDVRLCIVEYCMFNDNPMHTLYQLMISEMCKRKEFFLNYSACKDYLLQLCWNSIGTGSDSLETKSSRRLNQLKVSLTEIYGNRFDDICKWIDHVVEYSRNNFKKRFIFSELFRMSKTDFFQFISNCVGDIGIPLVFNSKHEAISLLPEKFDHNEFIQLFSAYGFMEYALSVSSECPLKQFCQHSNKAMMNNFCDTNPIQRAKQTELCPMGQFVKTYGFHQIKWVNS